MIKRWIASVMLACVIATAAHAGAPKIGEGDMPPDVFGKDESGQPISLERLRGKVVILTFWATWCPYCLKELPILENIQNLAGKDRIEVIAINWKEDRDTYRAVKRRLKDLTLTLTSDTSGRIGEAYGVQAIPHMLMIGKDGRVDTVRRGYSEEDLDDIAADLTRLLKAPAPAVASASGSEAAGSPDTTVSAR
ncbi:TlpA disulfide reductase family protein [Lysobacter sp.]|uniref:TlpA family protein disulfide reductase n=1 Tax=Lysobacter sp. TaxID=72226 RepID=UPI002D4D3037|nr:TlpA disulfide reductase family protein [Lysobacter sp.]HZX79052.1 TlpA disulfide reductase family protein [Lysobacter sp.]